MNQNLFNVLLDNIPDGIYVLDNAGNTIYANSAYARLANMSKSELIGYNVHEFLATKTIDFCISDVVYEEKRRVVMLQNVFDRQNPNRKIRQSLVVSSPIFDEQGDVCNIIAVVRPVRSMNDDYHQAILQERVSYRVDTQPINKDVIAESPEMLRLLKASENVANVDSTVLLTGESGTGKEVLAQFIHNAGDRGERPLVVINCASLPPALLETELFGYDKGAFTGASVKGKIGLFEEADQGTLLLDEVNSLPLELQGKLLRAIETKSIQRIGSTKTHPVNFRLIATTNEDLQAMVREQRFRSDLYYRLNVIPLHIPPLRERREDILPLTFYYLKFFCEKHNISKILSDNTLAAMQDYDWPGNVRELKNFVERSVVMSMGEFIEIPNVRAITGGAKTLHLDAEEHAVIENHNFHEMLEGGVTFREYMEQCEAAYLRHALETYGNASLVAKALGISLSSVMRRKKKFDY
jgi:PAS domain S-box